MRIAASFVEEVTSGSLVGANCDASGIAFDSRALVQGQVFVAITAERDGHDFLADARERGAAFAIVERGRSIDGLPCVEVEDTEVAIAQLATAVRLTKMQSVDGRVVGVTGSAGKTSTKDFIFSVLRTSFASAHCSPASLNNDIGVPATILNAPDDCDALVLEMGMRGFGEIERLCSIGQPTIGVLTNIGDAHSERVGGVEGVARAKFELLHSLPTEGIAVVNADDEMTMAKRNELNVRIVSFGSHVDADVRWVIDSVDADGRAQATFSYEGESVSGRVGLPGRHMVANAAAAVAVGIICGISLSTCVAGLQSVVTQGGRTQWKQGINGIRILDDSYNANTVSMLAALRLLAEMAGRRIAVLGKMSEISDAEKQHKVVAEFAREHDIEILACETELYDGQALSVDDIVARVQQMNDVCVLVKGSRAAETERVVHLLGA